MAKKKTTGKSKAKTTKKELTLQERLLKHQCPRCNAFGYNEAYSNKSAGMIVEEYVCGNCGLRLPADQVPE